MIKVLSRRFHKFWVTLTCWLSKDVLKRRFSERGLTKSLTVGNLRNTLAMTIIFFFKMFKYWWRCHKWNKKVSRFSDNCIWIRNCKSASTQTAYVSSAASVLRKSRKISNFNKGDIFGIILSSEWLKNMIKVLSCRFHKCLGDFNMLNVEGSSETTLFRERSKQNFDSL